MHRFYLPPEQCRGATLVLEEREAHHGLHVLRLRQGDRVAVLDGVGNEFLCEARKFSKDSIGLAVTQKHPVPRLPYSITLVQAVPKGKTMDLIVQKAAELGAARVVPLLSERVVAHLEKDSARTEKWRQVAIEAIKQCGSAWLPEIEQPLTPKEFLARNERFDLPLIASLQPDSRHPRERFQSFRAEKGRAPQSVAVWVGPEGDFTPAEMNAARSAGALPITLGRLILRSETAAIYCLSVLNYELQSASAG
jgi:16S rRNA (uracil1498-N3)-methyltransferase